ncbi:hypothetical protein BvCmsNSP038_03709 [Escherichia coli]|uniref:hypothetical protein n=1 Tax=Escherichia coli TaxID=562 RepID=UPI0010E2FD87|nr:hypothetical protein [Escherichia coli]GDM59556.1 hypothetical protein BvCmsNSNP024_00813 [Escherichia coli]GDQ01845.1 hypothetical protein BvCmsNSP038_03709 [Escherichia coli]
MIEQLQSDFLFWIFIYFLIVGLLIRNIHLTRKIKSIEKNKMFPAEEYAVLDIEQHMSNKYIGRLVTRFMKRTNGAPLLIVFPEYDKGDNNEDKNSPPFQLEIILSRLKNGENTGFEHDDDFGYSFQYDAAAVGKSSFFDEAAGRK